MAPDLYGELLRVARRCSRRPEEAEELAHDVIAEALRRGLTDWNSEDLRRWLRGSIRRRAAFLARGAARRRRREQFATADTPPWSTAEMESTDQGAASWTASLSSLPRSLRTMAILLGSGMSRPEVRHILQLSDVALRQRLTKLRKAWSPTPGLSALPSDDHLALGVLRQALRQTLRRFSGQVLGTHDPDGHLLLFAPRGAPRKKNESVAHNGRGLGN